MSRSPSNGRAPDVERTLDDIADHLYTLLPESFAAARDDEIRRARDEGRQPLARELAKLRRPTQSAWVVNLLSRHEPGLVEELLGLGDDLSRAQADASVADLQRLTARRRELETQILRRAHDLAGSAGVNLTANMERDVLETLAAALASSDAAAEVRSGRLVKPLSYAGFGPGTVAPPPARAERQEPEEAEKDPSAARQKSNGRAAPAAPQASARVREATRRLEEAQSVGEAADRELANRRGEADAAHRRHEELKQQAEELRARVRELDKEASAAQRAAVAADRLRLQAEKNHEAAARNIERAKQQLKEREG